MENDLDAYLSIKDIAERENVDRTTVQRWIKAKRLEANLFSKENAKNQRYVVQRTEYERFHQSRKRRKGSG